MSDTVFTDDEFGLYFQYGRWVDVPYDTKEVQVSGSRGCWVYIQFSADHPKPTLIPEVFALRSSDGVHWYNPNAPR